MAMTATRRPAPAKAPERKPATRTYLTGLWLEHCPAEAAATLGALMVFVVLFAGLGGTTPAAYTAATATVTPWAWWLTSPASRRRRYARKVEAMWVRACANLGLYSHGRLGQTRFADLANITVDEHRNVTADITLPPGLWFAQYRAAQDRFEAVYGRGNLRSLRIDGDDDHRTGKLTITRWVAFDRHTVDPVAYHPGRGIAVKETGEPVRLAFGADGANILIAGIKGSGKSSYENACIAESVHAPHPVRRWGSDLKQVEFAPWAPVFERLALTPQDTTTMLEDAVAEYEARRDHMRAHGIRKHYPGCGFDPLVIFVDELRELLRDWPGEERGAGDQRGDLLASLAALGRATAIQVIVATQNPLAKYVGEIRQNCDLTICCRVRTETESFTALGDIGRQLRPDRIPGNQPGVSWIVGDDTPYRARARWLDDHQVAHIAGKA